MLKRFLAVLSVAVCATAAVRAEQVEVTYLSGTIKAIPAEVASKLDTTAPNALELETLSSHISIPYAAISSYEYRVENRFHLGVLPAIAVGALKARTKRHLLAITWKDETNVAQTVTFEMKRDRAQGIVKVLNARAPQACEQGLAWRSKR